MQSNLENLSLQDLSDMLLIKTKELLDLKEIKNADAYAILALQIEVQDIKEAIHLRRTQK